MGSRNIFSGKILSADEAKRITGAFWGDIWDWIKNFFGGIWDAITSGVKAVFNFVKDVVVGIAKFVKDVVIEIGRAVLEVGKTLINLGKLVFAGVKFVSNVFLGKIDSGFRIFKEEVKKIGKHL